MMVGGGIGMMMPGMGMMMGDMGYMQMQMQMQQQMMQMQMQAYQQAMQMQQQRIQQQMAQQRVIAGLTQELYTLMFRLQQAQMGMYTSGYSPIILPSFPSNPGWGVTPQPYPAPGVPIPPNVPGGANPGNGGPPRFR
jgi:type II secretory pathway pseudopilin PulG